MLNERVLNSVGKHNYNEYMLLTDGSKIDDILDSKSPVFEMYKYKDRLIDKGVGQNITFNELEELLKDNDDIGLKQSLEHIFLDYLTDSEFKIVKDMLVNHKGGWSFNRLLEIHKRYKYYRIFSILTIDYESWLNC